MPVLPEIMMRSFDLEVFPEALKLGKDDKSPITDDDVEAYKYTFGKTGIHFITHYTPTCKLICLINLYIKFILKFDFVFVSSQNFVSPQFMKNNLSFLL